jgi:hypothetical protein
VFLVPDSYNKMPDVDLAIRHPALQSMCSKDRIVRFYIAASPVYSFWASWEKSRLQ